MKVTLAIVLAVLVCSALDTAAWMQSPQQSTPGAQMPQLGAGDAASQQQGTPPAVSKPCTESKDTCEVEPTPQAPTNSPDVKGLEQLPQAKPSAATATHSKNSRRHKRAKNQAVAQDPSGPKKVIVRQGGTADPTVVLTPGGPARDSYSPQMTAELLSATDANLKEATSKPLTATQEETIDQIKLFMEQANAAVKAGDLDRGHNLAIKAHLLSDDLVKH
jgi:hypothetical protein